MKPLNFKSERLQKWGLYSLLLSSLGFSLSMNPDHFNSIARNERGQQFHSMDLAATQAEVRVVDNELDAKEKEETAETTRASRTTVTRTELQNADAVAAEARNGISEGKARAISINNLESANSKKKYNVTVFEVSGNTYARFQTEAQGECDLCKSIQKLNAKSLDEAVKLGMEIKELADNDGKTKDSDSDSSESTSDKKKKTKKENEKRLSDLAAKCKDRPREDRLTCHSENLIKLSKDLNDSSDSKDLIRKYFDTYLLRPLAEGFSAKTADPVTGSVSYTKLQEADELARQLIEDLDPENSEPVIAKLTKLKAGSYSAQIVNARDLYMNAQYEKASKDPFTMRRGFQMEQYAIQMLNPTMLSSNLAMDTQNWTGALESGNKDEFMNLLRDNFSYPVQRLVGQVGELNPLANPQDLATRLNQFSVPDLSAGSFGAGTMLGMNATLPIGTTTLPHTAGLPGNLPIDNLLQARTGGRIGSYAAIPFGTRASTFPGSNAVTGGLPQWMQNNQSPLMAPAPVLNGTPGGIPGRQSRQ